LQIGSGAGLYYTSPLGSGMDNTPQRECGEVVYVDFSLQQALAALSISKLAALAGDTLQERIF